MRADRTRILRLTGLGRTEVHAAHLAPGWEGRAFCGTAPRSGQLWDLAEGQAVTCRACEDGLRALAERQAGQRETARG
jgi:hypothetical protein